jgi:hypothetical protein
MIRSRHRPLRVAAVAAGLVLVPLALAGCGKDDTASTTTTTKARSTTTAKATTTTTEAGATGSGAGMGSSTTTSAAGGGGTTSSAPNTFELTTADNRVSLSGKAQSCTSNGETTLSVVFSNGSKEVIVSATNGTGRVMMPGQFEGTIQSISVGDTGSVRITGKGSAADDTAKPTTFTVTGNCA